MAGPVGQGLRTAGAILAGAVLFFGLVGLAYEMAVARVPQHRAALERLVRAQTGLDAHFDELGLRWGWYGPEAVFRHVELGEPGHSAALLRTPELVVGFDVWQSVRSGQLAAGRLTLVAPDIDLSGAGGGARTGVAELRASVGAAVGRGAGRTAGTSTLSSSRAGDDGALQILQRWRGGLVDLEGGTLRLADPSGTEDPLTLQIRRASLRRAGSEWSGYGLVFLPERLGRTARVVVSVTGDLERPQELRGSVRFEGRRLEFAGWRELLAGAPAVTAYVPRAGGGDFSFDADFAGGRVTKASGRVAAAEVEWALRPEAATAAGVVDTGGDHARAPSGAGILRLDRLRGDWRLAERDSGWRLQVAALELGDTTAARDATHLDLDIAASGRWIRGALAELPLQAAVAAVSSFAPQLAPSSAQFGGVVQNIAFDWNAARGAGRRLRASARLTGASLASPERTFRVSGLMGQLSVDDAGLDLDLQTVAARLVTGGQPLDGVHLNGRVRLEGGVDSWRIATGRLELQQQDAHLRLAGALVGDREGGSPMLEAHAELAGADLAFLERLGGESLMASLAAAAPRLMAGSLDTAQIDWRGPFDAALGGWRGAQIRAALSGARLQAVAGLPPIDAVKGTLIFDNGHLRRSTLAGAWLGGPVTLTVGERREHGSQVLAVQARGLLDAQQLSLAAAAGAAIDTSSAPGGHAAWSGELVADLGEARSAQWRVRGDSNLVGVTSHLPEPLTKSAGAALPLHIEAQGSDAIAQVRLSLGERLRSRFELRRRADSLWGVERGGLQFGAGAPELPAIPAVLLRGRLARLDLAAYVAAWQQLSREQGVPLIQADLAAGELLVAGRSYPDVRVTAQRSDSGADLQLQSPDISGTAHWPAPATARRPARLHFARLDIPAGGAFGASAELIAALGPATELAVEDIVWDGRSLGSASATVTSHGRVLDVSDLRLASASHSIQGEVHCESAACRVQFSLDSRNVAATLEDFGFRPDLSAARALLQGDLEWRAGSGQPPLATLTGRLNMRLLDGMTRSIPDPNPRGTPFPLLLVPALVNGLGAAQNDSLQVDEPHGLRFSRLEADFTVADGEADTSNLHFDGDAEILMRGRTGLLAHDYDQHVWILRGEGRLPSPVRRLGATPGVAAAWLSIRELFGGGRHDTSTQAPLHLQGSWDDPIVVAAE